MDQNHNRKKRVRKDQQGDSSSEKKIKPSKRQEHQDCNYANKIDNSSHQECGSDSDVAALGVFDFPWLKDGVDDVARSEEWKLEDVFVSELQKETDDISAGIEFPFPGNCSFSRTFPISDCSFPTEKFEDEEYERCRSSSSPLEDIGFETAESFDRIWSAFA